MLSSILSLCVSIGLLLSANAVAAYSCHNVGNQKVIYDPHCSTGHSLGCNAGGQGQNCRFSFAVPNEKKTTKASSCHNVGKDKVIYDPSCSSGQSLGCNAGGQGQNCRFCWATQNKCSQPNTTSVPTTTQPKKTTTKTSEPPTNRCQRYPMSQTRCTKEELKKCNCGNNQFCCLEGDAHSGCLQTKWNGRSCTCACQVVPFPVPNCTFDQYLFTPCNVNSAPYYCPSTNGCAPSRFRCTDLCYLTRKAPYPARPPNTGSYSPGSLKSQDVRCGAQNEPLPPKCTTQPNEKTWKHYQHRSSKCNQNQWWCKFPSHFTPSKYQCGPTIGGTTLCPMGTIQAKQCRISPQYKPPTWAPALKTATGYCDTSDNCDNTATASHCVGCCSWNNPERKCYNFWQQGRGKSCRQTSPRWNWIITTCDSMGGIDFGGACQQNPFSTVDIRYVATYELTKRASDNAFVWKIIPDSSINWKGDTKLVDFSSLPTEHTGTGVIRSCSGGGGGWNGAFFPYKTDGATPPAMMFVLSYSKFENAAWFMLNQRILDGGPAIATCKDKTNCWGEISAGEIDFLETPNLFPNKWKTEQGWNINRLTSYNAANRCWACNHAFKDGSFNVAGCGGEPANSFYDANTESSDQKEHFWVAVVDARGTTVYKDPVWPGISSSCAAEELINLHPEKPSQSQPCTNPTSTCAMYLPGCVTEMTPEMTQLTNGDYSRIPYCYYVDWALHITCTENWWNLMIDTGQWEVDEPRKP